jgi:hypothetical protein
MRSLAPLLRGEGEERRASRKSEEKHNVSVSRHNSSGCRNRDAIR